MNLSRRAAPAATLALVAISLCAPAAADEPGIFLAGPEEPEFDGPPRLLAAPYFRRLERGPRLEFGYRTFTIGELANQDARFHCFAIDYHFYSGYFRSGVGVEVGGYSAPRKALLLEGTVHAGAQFPFRVTPFLDVLWGGGFTRRDILHQDQYGFSYHVGVEGGISFFIRETLLVSFTLGWRRQVFRHNGNVDVQAVYVYFDSLTIKTGLGF